MEQDIQDNVSSCNKYFTIVWLVLDFLQLYTFYATVSLYYLLCKDLILPDSGYTFLNDAVRGSYMAFVIMHMLSTFLPLLIVPIARQSNVYVENTYSRNASKCTRASLVFYGFFQLYFLRIALGPRLTIDYSLREDMKVGYAVSRAGA